MSIKSEGLAQSYTNLLTFIKLITRDFKYTYLPNSEPFKSIIYECNKIRITQCMIPFWPKYSN